MNQKLLTRKCHMFLFHFRSVTLHSVHPVGPVQPGGNGNRIERPALRIWQEGMNVGRRERSQTKSSHMIASSKSIFVWSFPSWHSPCRSFPRFPRPLSAPRPSLILPLRVRPVASGSLPVPGVVNGGWVGSGLRNSLISAPYASLIHSVHDRAVRRREWTSGEWKSLERDNSCSPKGG